MKKLLFILFVLFSIFTSSNFAQSCEFDSVRTPLWEAYLETGKAVENTFLSLSTVTFSMTWELDGKKYEYLETTDENKYMQFIIDNDYIINKKIIKERYYFAYSSRIIKK